MNRAPRFVNRLLLAGTGLVLLCLGALALGLAVVPAVRDTWQSVVPPLLPPLAEFWTPFWSWLAVAATAAALVLVVLFLAAQFGGRTEYLRVDGDVTVEIGVARDVLERAITSLADVEGVSVRAMERRGVSVSQVVVRVRRGAELPQLTKELDRVIGEWTLLLGSPFPCVVELVPAGRAIAARAA